MLEHVRLKALLAMIALFLFASCTGSPTQTPGEPAGEVSADVLLEADRQFALEVGEKGLEAWVGWFDEEGLQLAPGEIVQGKDAIRAHMSAGFDADGFLLEWEPEHASIAASGDLGYTYGRYVMHRTGEDGGEILREGRYVTIWKKQADDSWKVALDAGVPDSPETP